MLLNIEDLKQNYKQKTDWVHQKEERLFWDGNNIVPNNFIGTITNKKVNKKYKRLNKWLRAFSGTRTVIIFFRKYLSKNYFTDKRKNNSTDII